MSRRNREVQERGTPAPEASGFLSPGTLRLATLAGVVVLVVIGLTSWKNAQRLERSLNDRLSLIENRLTQIQTRVDAAARSAQARPSGPDPNRVYAVKTDASPAIGPKTAPVVIAEFSDFQ